MLGFKYYVGKEGGDDFVFVPTGTTTDFASVPRLFWSIIPPDGRWSQSSVLHDFLYTKKSRPRKECDVIFRDSMKVLGVSWWRRNVMFAAVRLFGGIPYNS